MIRITRIEPTKYTTAIRKKKVAAYCRVSTNSSEQLSSLESQKAHYSEMIESNPDWEFAGLYYDRGLSGTSMQKRDGLNSMLKDCRDGKINYIITKSISRFARNAEDCLRTVRELYSLHIYIRFEKEGIDTETMDSEMMLSVLSSVAADESRSISENVHWSIIKKFEDGTYNQGMAPYGYRNTDGVLTVFEEEAEIIRYIFDETLKGSGGNVIARALNERGITAPRNGKWNANTITAIIRNERYVGDALYQKTYNDINYKKCRNKGELQQYYSRDHHEPIVSRETFEAAKAMIERNRKLKGIDTESDKYQQRYSMSGKIVCAECGGKLRRRTNMQDGQEPYISWVCKTHLHDKASCSLKAIRNESIENAFVTMMNKLIFGYKQVLHPYIDSLRSLDRQASVTSIDELEAKLEKNTVAGLKLKELYGKGYFDPALYAKEMVELASEREKLTKEKEELSGRVANNSHLIEETRFLIQYASMGSLIDAYCDDLFVRFGDQVIVYSREFIGFKLKCGLTLKERISA